MGRKKKSETIVTRQICLECALATQESSDFACTEDRPEFWNNPQGYDEATKKGVTLPGNICPKFKEAKRT